MSFVVSDEDPEDFYYRVQKLKKMFPGKVHTARELYLQQQKKGW